MTSPDQISAAPARPRTDAAPLLDVRGLGISFAGPDKRISVVRDVTFSVAPGECVGLVGESGCGKTVTGLALMGLLPVHGSRFEGQLLLDGEDLLTLSEAQWRKRRGRRLGMIFQEPMSALDPVFTIGEQIGETLRTHFRISRREARDRAIEALEAVGISEPVRRHDAYPHELSGGMRQRAMIAMAISCEPALLIADEPTTALDVSIQGQILAEVRRLADDTGTAIVWVSHDLAVVSSLADEICVMYAGRIVESGPAERVIAAPRHPYTRGLIASVPSSHAPGGRLPQIPGSTPQLSSLPAGCPFRPRCDRATDLCVTEPPRVAAAGRTVLCHHPLEVAP